MKLKENEIREVKIKIKTLRNGQTEKYGDLNYEYKLDTKGLTEKEVKLWCTNILQPCKQTKDEWNRDDINSYFRGYYKFEKINSEGYGTDEVGVYKYFVYFPSTH